MKVRYYELDFVTHLQHNLLLDLLFACRKLYRLCIIRSCGSSFWCSKFKKLLWMKHSLELCPFCRQISSGKECLFRCWVPLNLLLPGCTLEAWLQSSWMSAWIITASYPLSLCSSGTMPRRRHSRRPRRTSLEFSCLLNCLCVSCNCWTQSSESCFNTVIYGHLIFVWWRRGYVHTWYM